jgi:DNA-binding FadR family transcriptional regulator
MQEEHEALLHAMENHDQRAAAQAMYTHMAETGNRLMTELEKEGEVKYDRSWCEGVVVPAG